MKQALKRRVEVNPAYTWNLADIFPNEEAVYQAMEETTKRVQRIVQDYSGRLSEPDRMNACLNEVRTVYEWTSRIVNYTSLNLSVDQTDEDKLQANLKASRWMAELLSQLSFVDSEILQQDESVIEQAISISTDNAHYLRDLLRFKSYTLHPEVERTLRQLDPILVAPYNTYNQTKLADMDFKPLAINGKDIPLSFSRFEEELEYEPDHEVRRAAFQAFYETLGKYQHTVASLYNTQVQKEKLIASLRGFDSVFDYLLFPQKVDQELYHRQIDRIMEKLAPHMRKYAALLKDVHQLDVMTFADLKIDVDPEYEPHVSFEEARAYLVEGLGVLGDDYRRMVERSFDERWIDFVANRGKMTGAFCSTPYGVHPYILVTFNHRMRDVMTLAHELGHAGHFYLMHQHQNYFNSEPSLYFIEAPSTLNELLMAHYLLSQSDDPRFQRWVLATLVSKTYYHNFVTHLLEAAYQREVYRIIDQGGSVQSSTLNQIKRDVLERFWGDEVVINEGAERTWMRQPHYYMGLYPYTYSAGLTIATKMSERIRTEGQSAIEDWLQVLMAGGTKTPEELAKMAKIDITTSKPLDETIDYIGSLIDEIIRLTAMINKKG